MPLESFPDVQAVLREALSPFGTFGVQTDAQLEDKLPFIVAREIGGSDNRVSDVTFVDVEVFTRDYSGKARAETVRQFLLSTPIRTSAGQLDYVMTETKPREIPWTDGATVRRWSATYRVSARR